MAKELPYFQFEPAEYLTKDISFCSLSAQGLFINLCSYYWQRECKLTTEQLLRRLNHPKELEELIGEKVISVIESVIKVSFLDDQYKNATKKSNTNSINGSKGGRPKKEKPIKTETKPKLNPTESELKGIREEKRRKEKKKEENNYRAFDHLSITVDEIRKLKEEYDIKTIELVLDNIENFGSNKKYKNLYLTAKNWLKKEPKKKSVELQEKQVKKTWSMANHLKSLENDTQGQ